MPIPFVYQVFVEGLDSVPYGFAALKIVTWLAVLYLIKRFFGGTMNTSERVMHGKVVLVTGGTSGIGAEVTRELASRGAQLVLLTQHALSDPFLVDYIMDLRASTNNDLITAEHCDLTSLHSIRLFATKWVDNAPPRRLDAVILCASILTPWGSMTRTTEDGVEENWGLNYLANFHLLSILSPAIRAQPPDRDVRIIFATCSSYVKGQLPVKDAGASSATTTKSRQEESNRAKSIGGAQVTQSLRLENAYSTSKLALMTFAVAFQKHLSAYKRPDSFPMNARVIMVDPGWSRTPGMQRYLTCGSLWGLLGYLMSYPLWWIILKSPLQGAQSLVYAAMDAEIGRGLGGSFIRECSIAKPSRSEVNNEETQQSLWDLSSQTVEQLERVGAARRAKDKGMSAHGKDDGKSGPDQKTSSRRSRKVA